MTPMAAVLNMMRNLAIKHIVEHHLYELPLEPPLALKTLDNLEHQALGQDRSEADHDLAT